MSTALLNPATIMLSGISESTIKIQKNKINSNQPVKKLCFMTGKLNNKLFLLHEESYNFAAKYIFINLNRIKLKKM